MNKSETQKYVCELREEIAKLEENVGYYKDSLARTAKNCDKLYHENKELKQRIAELESEGTKTIDDCKQSSVEWYDKRHQSDCIRINQLNVALDVMTEKYQRLRELKGL